MAFYLGGKMHVDTKNLPPKEATRKLFSARDGLRRLSRNRLWEAAVQMTV